MLRRYAIRLLAVGGMLLPLTEGQSLSALSDGCGYSCAEISDNAWGCIPTSQGECNASSADLCYYHLSTYGPDCERACTLDYPFCSIGSPFNPCENGTMTYVKCYFTEL